MSNMYMPVLVHVATYTYVYSMDKCTSVYMYVCVCVYAYMSICVDVYVYMYICMYM